MDTEPQFDNRDQLFKMNDDFEIGNVDVYKLFYDSYISNIYIAQISESDLSDYITEKQTQINDKKKELDHYWRSLALVDVREDIEKMNDPITLRIFRNPVMINNDDRHTFDLKSITKWVKTNGC